MNALTLIAAGLILMMAKSMMMRMMDMPVRVKKRAVNWRKRR
jgi:hypothetical protein